MHHDAVIQSGTLMIRFQGNKKSSFGKRIGWEDIRQKKQRFERETTFEERFPQKERPPLSLIGVQKACEMLSGYPSDFLEDQNWNS